MKNKIAQVIELEKNQAYIQKILDYLNSERINGKKIYPEGPHIFHALDSFPLDKTKVVILGQDPYHGMGQAHGLAFSVKRGVSPPPSLVNIFKELQSDLGVPAPKHGNLESWAKQGVLLLNTVLSVEEGRAGSHQHLGWENFTDKIIQIINQELKNVVFILWGNHAQKKIKMINTDLHHTILSPHPSPLSCYRGFFGSRPFSRANAYLISKGISPVDWRIST
jgi:uracil-DNA glycosylase